MEWSGRHTVASVVLGATAAVGLAVVFTGSRDQPRTVSDELAASSAVEARPFDVFAQLPRLRLGTPTFLLDGRLWYGDLPMARAWPPLLPQDVVVSQASGWLLQWRVTGGEAGRMNAMGDSFEEFSGEDDSNFDAFAASPDGRWINVGANLLDRAGRFVGHVPQNLAVSDAWTPAGYTYLDANGEHWVWNPGTPPAGLPGSYDFRPDGLSLTTSAGCSYVDRLTGAGTVQRVLEFCDGPPIVTLSPSGARAVTRDGRVVAVTSGAVVGRLALGRELAEAWEDMNVEVAWWSNRLVYFSLTAADAWEGGEPYSGTIVGCRLDGSPCGRVAPVMDLSDDRIPLVYRE